MTEASCLEPFNLEEELARQRDKTKKWKRAFLSGDPTPLTEELTALQERHARLREVLERMLKGPVLSKEIRAVLEEREPCTEK